jgi:hypothetical protein
MSRNIEEYFSVSTTLRIPLNYLANGVVTWGIVEIDSQGEFLGSGEDDGTLAMGSDI